VLIITGGDAPEILEPAKAAFDNVASLVGTFVEAVEGCSVGLVRNDGDCAATDDVGAEASSRRVDAAAMSASWPGVRWNAQGLQSGSLKAWIFVVRPPRERPIACSRSPLFRHWPSDGP
jgi:hypothetical protein